MRCSESGDFLRFLDKMIKIKEDLAGLGGQIEEEEFLSIITQAVPKSYQQIILTQQTTHNILKAAGTVTGDLKLETVMKALTAEAQTRNEIHRGSFRKHHAHLVADEDLEEEDDQEGSIADQEDDSANMARHKGKKPFRSKQKKPGKFRKGKKHNAHSAEGLRCFNCNGTGHFARECPEKQDKPYGNKGKWKPKGSRANAVLDTVPTASVAEISADDDWAFIGDYEIPTSVEDALFANYGTRSEIFDSGASRHMSPYRDQFIQGTYKPLTGHTIRAANRSTFNAKGTGDVLIEVPCGNRTNKVILKDTLYAPDIHATLVSLAKFDMGGCTSMIKAGKLVIRDKLGREICHVPRRENNLYQLFHGGTGDDGDDAELVEANSGTDQVSMEELHRKLGHVSAGYIRKLIAKKTLGDVEVTGLDIPLECKACLQGKATQVPIAKEPHFELLTLGTSTETCDGQRPLYST